MSISEWVQVAATVAVFVTLVFGAVQTRHLAVQIRQNNIATLVGAHHTLLERLHTVLAYLVEDPALRVHFYENVDTDGLDPKVIAKTRTLAEMFADALEYGLVSSRDLSLDDQWSEWACYAEYMIRHSPPIRAMVAAHRPTLWGSLATLLEAYEREQADVAGKACGDGSPLGA